MKKKLTRKIIEMSNNNDYTTDNLLDFAYFKENYKLIAVDLSKQTKLKDPQQSAFSYTWSNNAFHHSKIRRNYP